MTEAVIKDESAVLAVPMDAAMARARHAGRWALAALRDAVPLVAVLVVILTIWQFAAGRPTSALPAPSKI